MQVWKSVLFICFGGILMLSSGCASIMCGPEDTVSIKSHPSSRFTIKDADGEVIVQDTAPTTVTLKRGSGWFKAGEYNVTFEKEGYQTATMPIAQGIEGGWYGLGNLVFGGLIGWVIVDPMTGAMYNINDVNVSLEPLPTTSDDQSAFNIKASKLDLVPLAYNPQYMSAS